MSTMSSKVYLARAGGDGEDENYALANCVAILDYREYPSLARAKEYDDNEAKQGQFSVRRWESSDLVSAIYRTYEKLPAEIQAELPLTRVWILVKEKSEE
jgi:predicted Mrr-cat superfamily restriction endonuclease